MTNDRPIVLSENVVIVEYHDTTSWSGLGLISTISDPSGTVQVEGLRSESVEPTPWLQIKSLFGAWAESGDEDEDLATLYKSRLIASSVTHDQE
jgi:hypothetical protein